MRLILTFLSVFALWPALLTGPVILVASVSWLLLLLTGQL